MSATPLHWRSARAKRRTEVLAKGNQPGAVQVQQLSHNLRYERIVSLPKMTGLTGTKTNVVLRALAECPHVRVKTRIRNVADIFRSLQRKPEAKPEGKGKIRLPTLLESCASKYEELDEL